MYKLKPHNLKCPQCGEPLNAKPRQNGITWFCPRGCATWFEAVER